MTEHQIECVPTKTQIKLSVWRSISVDKLEVLKRVTNENLVYEFKFESDVLKSDFVILEEDSKKMSEKILMAHFTKKRILLYETAIKLFKNRNTSIYKTEHPNKIPLYTQVFQQMKINMENIGTKMKDVLLVIDLETTPSYNTVLIFYLKNLLGKYNFLEDLSFSTYYKEDFEKFYKSKKRYYCILNGYDAKLSNLTSEIPLKFPFLFSTEYYLINKNLEVTIEFLRASYSSRSLFKWNEDQFCNFCSPPKYGEGGHFFYQ